VKTQQVARSRGQRCGDIELAAYLANAAGPVPLVLDLRITHDRFGSSSVPSLNEHLHYPNDLDGALTESAAAAIATTSTCLHSEFVRLLFLQAHRETYRFFAASGVQLPPPDRDQFHYRRAAFSSNRKWRTSLPRLQLYVPS
jgi:hypothetical protein